MTLTPSLGVAPAADDTAEHPSAAEGTAFQAHIRSEIRRLCDAYPDAYWRELDKAERYPTEFVAALAEGGWLGALIPSEYGGAGLGVIECGAILEEINATGGNAGAVHAQMYIMSALLRHGSEEQKQRYLPEIAAGRLRLQAFGVTEPNSGSDTTAIETFAHRVEGGYAISGQKVFTSRALHSDLMLLIARTTPLAAVDKRTRGMSLFLIDLREHVRSIEIRPIDTMINHSTTAVFLNDVTVGEDARIGAEGEGFRYLLDSLNAERVLIAYECLGDARFFIDRATKYAGDRRVFDRAIGANQGIQFPIAKAWLHLQGARLVCERAATLLDGHAPTDASGAAANAAKYLCAEASWEAANVAMDTLGGYGMAREYDVERKFRETRLYQVAPVTNNMILSFVATKVLGLPRSY
jgi:acyl-CoA dehydrogenase